MHLEITPPPVHCQNLLLISQGSNVSINATLHLSSWPSPAEREVSKAYFERKFDIFGACLCLDGVLMAVQDPLHEPQRYVNRHHTYSVLVQAVCDHRMLYRDIYAGEAGSIGDRRNFQRSPLSRNLLTCPEMLSDGEHVVADSAYTCSSKISVNCCHWSVCFGYVPDVIWVMCKPKNVSTYNLTISALSCHLQILTPYINDHHLTRRHRVFNALLSVCRSTIERSFALLRSCQRRLKFLPIFNLLCLIDHVIASMVLNNFRIFGGEDSEVSV